jgi:hypothetical protein
MDERVLETQFKKIGARLVVGSHQWSAEVAGRGAGSSRSRRSLRSAFKIDIRDDRNGEYFWLSVGTGAWNLLEFLPLNVRPDLRHLVLMASGPDANTKTYKSKFLCGHDERHWFAAVLPEDRGPITSVTQAFEALKPAQVQDSQARQHVRPHAWNRRHNAGFIRQGEWFFVPAPAFEPGDSRFLCHNEPLQAGRHKAHMAEWLYRAGGVSVYVCTRHPDGLTEKAYRQVLEQNREAKSWNWRVMQRDAQPYVRGRVRHPDHNTIVLPFWHRVYVSAESAATGSQTGLVFLD